MKNRKIRQKQNSPDFHISGFAQDELITIQNGGLDNIGAINCDMYNFGYMEDLPDSDRAMIPFNQTCNDYKPDLK